jgi:uncharacterized membrane protein YhaH (DUF805 family)
MQYFWRAFPAAFVSALLLNTSSSENSSDSSGFLAAFVSALLFNGTSRDIAPIVLVFALLIAAFIIPQGIKRLHDLNLSGWWVLVGAIPFLGPLCGIVIIFTRGTRGPNRYGPDPLAALQSSGDGQQGNARTTE